MGKLLQNHARLARTGGVNVRYYIKISKYVAVHKDEIECICHMEKDRKQDS